MIQADPIQEYLTKLTPMARGNLLTELERLEACGDGMAGCEEILATLRAEFRTDESTQPRAANASRYFFAPLEPLLIDGAPEHANSGRICVVRWLRSGNGSAETCCRRWRATTSTRSTS